MRLAEIFHDMTRIRAAIEAAEILAAQHGNVGEHERAIEFLADVQRLCRTLEQKAEAAKAAFELLVEGAPEAA